MARATRGASRLRAATAGCALALALAGPARAESLALQVNRAIERGVAFARTQLAEDGTGRTSYHGSYPTGDTALLLYTLVKSGVSPDDPQVAKGLAWLRYQPNSKTYSTALTILALDALKDKAYDEAIRSCAKWLDERFHAESRRWAYPENHTDLSNTQFAALGLWIAERHGFKARPEVWGGLLTGVVELQRPDGGFAYHSDREATGAMTVAGITVLELALARAPESEGRFVAPRRVAKAALARAWEYLDRRFTVRANPLGAHALQGDWYYYYLYGVERLAAITGRNSIGGKDWYAEGARAIVAEQREDGSWGTPAIDTCFALLFLRRATATTMDRDVKPLEGEGVEAPAPVRKPGANVPFVRRWLVLGPVDNPDDALLDRPLFDEGRCAPRPYSSSAGFAWTPRRSLHDAVDLGDATGPRHRALSCAFTYLHARTDVDAVLWFGHDDAARVLLDGKLVHDHHFHGAHGADSFPVPVRLAAGVHRLLVKVDNVEGPHRLWLRIATPEGWLVADVLPSLSASDEELGQLALCQPGLFSHADLLDLLPRDPRLAYTFDVADHVEQFAVEGSYGRFPEWRGEPGPADSNPPNPGAFGFLGLHPESADVPSTAYWRVRVPQKPSRLRVRASATPGPRAAGADVVLKLGVFDGAMTWVLSEVVGPDAAPGPANWRWFEADLSAFAGKEAVVLLVAANGGRRSWFHEALWIDEVQVRVGE